METPLITIRRMKPEDVHQITRIEADCFSEPWPEQAFLDACNDTNYCYLVALEGNLVVGYAGCTISFEDADITNVAVRTSHRRLGIAAKLLEVMLAQTKKSGVTSVFLEVRESNLPARTLYESLGFQYVGKRPRFYRLPDEDALLMKADLTQGEVC